jgi:hypothetical protein
MPQDRRIGGLIRTNDHLCRLARRRKAFAAFARKAALACFVPAGFDVAHSFANGRLVLFWGVDFDAIVGGQLYIDLQTVRLKPYLFDQFRGGIGDCLEVDISANILDLAQTFCNAHHGVHRSVG